MSSNINPNNIDGTFPIAGQDNSSQGFRDNFTNIVNNFSYAASEISDLQSKAIVTSALTGQTLTNDMAYNQIQYAQLFSPSYTFLNLGTPTGSTTVTLDYSQSSFQKFTTNGTYTIAFANWPTSGQMGELTLWINVVSQAHTLTFPITSPGITIGLSDIAGSNTSTGTLTFDAPGNYFLRFRSSDAGQNISISDLSRNLSTLRDPNLYWNDNVTPTLLVGYGTTQTEFQSILGYETGQDTISAKGSYNSVSVGNLTLANINYPYIDTGGLAGYSVTSLRGNLQTATFTVSNSNDFLGYLNAITYTGTGVSEPYTFEQVSSIGFYATGSNAITGLGGNIAMFTHVPGTSGNLMVQAVGIENDQSAHFYGNVTVASAIQNSGSAASGALQVTGGVGIGGNIYTAGNLSVASTTTAVSSTSGAVVVTGGVGVGGNVYVGGNVNASCLTLTSALHFANLTTTQIAAITGLTPGMTVYNYTTGNIQVYNGTKWANVTLS